MPRYRQAPKPEGVPLTVNFPNPEQNPPLNLLLHPDGMRVDDSLRIQQMVEQRDLAMKRLKGIRNRLAGGTISAEEYDEETKVNEEGKAKALLDLQTKFESGEISQADYDEGKANVERFFKEIASSLLAQRDGVKLEPEEFAALQVEELHWLKLSSIRPIAIPQLRGCLLEWDYYEDEEAEARKEALPITHDSINSFGEDELLLTFLEVVKFYKERSELEKKSSANGSGLMTVNGREDAHLNGGMPIELQRNGDLTPIESCDGEPENFAVAL